MTVTPPRLLAPKTTNIWSLNPTLDYELAQEKASALGRLARLRGELAQRRERGLESASEPAERRNARRALVANAGHALWLFVVQREAIGLRDTGQLMRDYRVPAEVQHRMGAFPGK